MLPVVIAWLLLFFLGFFLSELSEHALPLCMMKLVAGIPCPVCGSMRALESLSRFEIIAAFRSNPLIVLFGFVTLVILVLRLLTGQTVRFEASNRQKLAAGIIVLVLFVANWIFLIIDGR